MPKTDHTAEIITELSITPETQPELHITKAMPNCECPDKNHEHTHSKDRGNYWTKIHCTDCGKEWVMKTIPVCGLLEGIFEADGLAVKLVEIARQKRLISSPQYAADLDGFTWAVHPNNIVIPSAINQSFAHAVHDALCEALGITEEGKV